MNKSVVILESPGKIKKIKSYLGSQYDVIASFGHCIDLPAKGLSVNIKNGFEPTFAVNEDKKDIMSSIKKTCKKSKAIYLMMDPDREGAGIARNIYEEIKNIGVPVYRSTSNEISQSKIKEAIANAVQISEEQTIYDAYVCRRILDRLAGYKTSFLTQQATGGRSAGRVQSAMLRIISEREKEIINFVPEEYWVLTGTFQTDKSDLYPGTLDEKVKVPDEKTALQIENKVSKGSPVVSFVESKEASGSPYAPFTTSTLIQSASSFLGWPAYKTMKVAQGLYETGDITYMRTDSPSMAKEAVSEIRSFIGHSYGDIYLNSSVCVYKSKKGSQEGHECCRPTDFSKQPALGAGDTQKLYGMIWKRAVACQMSKSKDMRTKVVTTVGGYDFITRGNLRLFDGFKKVWDYTKADDVLLPKLKQGEKVSLTNLEKDQKWTTPPNRYSDASLQKKCDAAQIARPATFASFLNTLEKRGYIKRTNKSFQAMDLGMRVVDFLVASEMCFVDLKFTAQLEDSLDDIASGKASRNTVLHNFWEKLKSNIETGKKVKEQLSITSHCCPKEKCGGKLLLKHSKFGPFFSCQNYKKEGGCSYVAKVGENGDPVEKVVKPKEYASFECEKCGSKMVKRKSSYGDFFGCEKFPTCKSISDLAGVFQPDKKSKFSKFKKKKSSKKKKTSKKSAKKVSKKSGKKK